MFIRVVLYNYVMRKLTAQPETTEAQVKSLLRSQTTVKKKKKERHDVMHITTPYQSFFFFFIPFLFLSREARIKT